jgi:hypothetical protein
MVTDKSALVITSCIYTTAPYTFLTDPGERKKQYTDSIIFFIKKSPFKRIVVCDNSGFNYPDSLNDLAREHNKQLELLFFHANNELVSQYGKGYGEGEILAFVLANSLLIGQSESFMKITGRLKLLNVEPLLRRLDEGENYFMPLSLLRPRFMLPGPARRCVDVRVYYTTKTFFKDHLLDAYKNVRDRNTFFLEHAYHQAMVNAAGQVKCFPVAPEITGMSGSNGWMFEERSYLKKIVTRMVLFLGWIKPIYRQKSERREIL